LYIGAMRLIIAALACCIACEAGFVAKPVSEHSLKRAVTAWQCPLVNCVLKSPLASAGPAFSDGVRFFAVGKDGKDARTVCPFDDSDDDKNVTTKEYMKYMKAMDKIGDMNSKDRRAYALEHADDYINAPVVEEKIKAPTIDVTKPGVEAVNSTTWSELRKANKFNFLITFYAPWCPHCKAFVTGENAPIKAFSASLEKMKIDVPKVVTFDVIGDTPPLVIDAVPTIYLFKTNGEALTFEGDGHDLEALMKFALQEKPASSLVATEVVKHLRTPSM